MFLSERGLPLPQTLRDLFAAGPEMRYIDYLHRCTQIAEALAAQDDERLAAAIQEAEAHNLIPMPLACELCWPSAAVISPSSSERGPCWSDWETGNSCAGCRRWPRCFPEPS